MNKTRKWYPTVVKGKKLQEIVDWLNSWADFNKHSEGLDDKSTIGNDNRPNHITDFGRGYHQAVSDIYKRFGFYYLTKPPHKTKKGDTKR